MSVDRVLTESRRTKAGRRASPLLTLRGLRHPAAATRFRVLGTLAETGRSTPSGRPSQSATLASWTAPTPPWFTFR
eukprot:1186293-Prorocentrum_minimum.AAC.3